ncbi:hypothetical protein [Microbispora bryophytorum]|uniref:hypothetical protein n=1 Tax=Microbispora bryophytorum TaxID=1460882 RepID=UPI00340BAB19
MSEVSALVLARRRYERQRDKAIRAGTWRGLVDAEDARKHVRELHRIWLVSYDAIGAVAGIPGTTAKHLVEGSPLRQLPPPARITARTSDALLTVTVDDMPDNYLVNAIGSTRRMQALAIAGWPVQQVSEHAEVDWTNLKQIRRGERVKVLLRVARRIRDAHEELIQLDPYAHADAKAVTRTRQQAVERKWHPAAAWAGDAIDDPAVKPWRSVPCSIDSCIHGSQDERLLCDNHIDRLRERGTLEGLRAQRNSKVLLENIRFILATDPPIDPETEEIDEELLAERLGMTDEALKRALLRAKITIERLRESA